MTRTLFSFLVGASILAGPLAGRAAGPDLTGTISAPESGEAGIEVEIPITIKNIGTEAVGTFGYRITIDPDQMADGSEPTRHDLVHLGEIVGGLAAGQERSEPIRARLPSPIRGDFYTFELDIDFQRRITDVDRTNNVVFSGTKMRNRKPHLTIRNGWTLNLVDGCFYGEPIEATFETCNDGRAEALGFYPGVVMGELSQMTLIEDVPAATAPQSCLSPDHPNYNPCRPVDGKTPHCVAETCRIECVSNADCSGGLVCNDDPLLADALGTLSAKSCMNWLDFPPTLGGVPKCGVYTMKGKIPVANQQGTYYANQKQRFHLISDVAFTLSESRPHQIASAAFDCKEALPDLVPSSMTPKGRVVAGELTSIARRIVNAGFIEHPRVLPPVPTPDSVDFEYNFYLSTAPDISVNQIPLVIHSTGGMGKATIARKGEDVGTDLVMIPANTAPGEYYIGLITDPRGQVRELSETNNVIVHPEKIIVEEPSLRIVTDRLPTATLGARFTHQLVAQGGIGPYEWAGFDLPPGISLAKDGMLSGVATDVGLFPFTARVTSGNHITERMLVLRTIPPQGSLEVTTTILPPAVRNIPYGGWTDEFGVHREGIPLAASGGTRPYAWSLNPDVSDNFMPQGLEFVSPEGIVRGTPSTLSQSRDIAVRVEDQLGNFATKTIRIVVVSSADLVITSQLFAEGTTGLPYDSCIEASGGDAQDGYSWSFELGTIPPGLRAEFRDSKACLVGTPTACSNFMVKATVSDAGGQSYSASIPLSVECDVIQLTTRSLPTVSRKEEVELQLASNAGSGAAVTYRLYQGSLPAGLSLGESGLISGKVADDAEFGGYNFLVQLKDGTGRQGLSALSISVRIEPRDPKTVTTTEGTEGCSTSGGPAGLLALGLGLALVAARRRRTSKDEIR